MADIAALLTGQSWISQWLLIDQPMIDRFAEATGDFQFIDMDSVRSGSRAMTQGARHHLIEPRATIPVRGRSPTLKQVRTLG